MFAILGALLFVVAYMRAFQSKRDFSDRVRKPYPPESVVDTVGQEDQRILGPPFITAGWIVIAVSCIVAAVEIVLLVLIIRI
jgi:hypothetical protein